MAFPPLPHKELPAPPHWTKAVGVGVVVVGMAMGTGELILWPHLVARYGLSILWFALVGITIQYFVNQEVARQTAATGESFFTSSARAISWSPAFWLFSAILLYIWPAWASALGTILVKLTGFGSYVAWAWASLALVLAITFSGRVAYRVLESALKVIVPTFFLLLVWISFLNLDAHIVKEGLRGLFSFGTVPENLDWVALLGAVVFAGAGGMLNLCVSLWYRDKQIGMAHYAGRIANPISGKPEAVSPLGAAFTENHENLERFRGWMRYVRADQGILFWLLGLITLFLLSVNAYAVLSPLGIVPQGLELVSAQARIFSQEWGAFGEKLYLFMAYLMLFSVMWTVLDALTRIVSDIIHTNSREGGLQKLFRHAARFSVHDLYYSVIVIAVVISAALVPLKQPLTFLFISSALGGLATALYVPLILFLNNRKLPWALRPSVFTNVVLAASAAFYWFFVVVIVRDYLG